MKLLMWWNHSIQFEQKETNKWSVVLILKEKALQERFDGAFLTCFKGSYLVEYLGFGACGW